MATNGKRNRSAGHQFEKDEVKRHSKYFKNLATTRACNRSRDACGIDVCIEDESKDGRLPIDISCKSSTSASIPYIKYLEKMGSEGRIGVVLHRRTQRPEFNTRTKKPGVNFVTKGEYAIMERSSYEQFLQHVYAIQVLRKKLPEVIAELEKNYDLTLLDVPKQIVL